TNTRLLREAKTAGCQTIGGLEMLVAQAAEQFEWWTGRKPVMGIMREAALKRLAGFMRPEKYVVCSIQRARHAWHVRAGLQGARRRFADAGLRVSQDRRTRRLRVPARER